MRRAVRAFDAAVDAGLDRLRGHRTADRLFYVASDLGDFSLVWVWLGALRGLRDGELRPAARVWGVALAESALVNGVVKSCFRRHRPPWEVERPHRLRRPLTTSFPSGHATSAACLGIVLAEGDRLWGAYALVGAVVATSRVYVRIHHASDVVGGALLGVGLGLVARRLVPLIPPGPGPRGER